MIYIRAPIKISAPSTNKGFTLVELAIVITIIGLLIGGVLKGQEMINNAKVTATIAQISSYTSATETFRDKYDNFPGDMAHATSRLPGCTAGNYCLNGNGDSRVGRFNPSYSWTELQSQAGIITLPEVEATMYWKHLALADLIIGVDPGADPENPVWGKTHPAGRFDGGFHQWNSNYGAHGQLFTGFVIQQRATMLGGYNTTGGERVGAMAPVHAAVIDRKMDDGLPDQGWVLSPDTYGECDNTTTTRQYNTTTAKKCNLTFRIF